MATPRDSLRIILVGTRNPLNIGAAARALSNFGARRLRLVRPYELAFREARSAVGAADLLAKAEVFGSVAEAVEQVEIVFGAGDQLHDLTSYTRHIGRDTSGQLLSKGVLLDRARAYMKGLISIEKTVVEGAGAAGLAGSGGCHEHAAPLRVLGRTRTGRRGHWLQEGGIRRARTGAV